MTNADIIVNLATMIAEQRLEISELKTEVEHLHHELIATMSEADTPQTDWKKEKSEKSLCNSCIKDCDNRKRNLYTVECNRYEPQTDCAWR